MFLPVQINLDPIIIGATYDPDALIVTEDGEMADLSAYTVTLTIHDDENTIKTLTESSGLTVAGGAIGILQTAAETAVLTAGNYSWYLTLQSGAVIHRYSEGKIAVRR